MGFFFVCDGVFWVFVGMGVGFGVLIMDWEIMMVVDVFVGVDFDFVVDVCCNFVV